MHVDFKVWKCVATNTYHVNKSRNTMRKKKSVNDEKYTWKQCIRQTINSMISSTSVNRCERLQKQCSIFIFMLEYHSLDWEQCFRRWFLRLLNYRCRLFSIWMSAILARVWNVWAALYLHSTHSKAPLYLSRSFPVLARFRAPTDCPKWWKFTNYIIFPWNLISMLSFFSAVRL